MVMSFPFLADHAAIIFKKGGAFFISSCLTLTIHDKNK